MRRRPSPRRPEFRIDGGMAKSRWFAQRLADLTGLEVARADYAEATALGAALFAGIGAGLFASMDEAAERPSFRGALPSGVARRPRRERAPLRSLAAGR